MAESWEADGRTFTINDDGSVTIQMNRADMLGIAQNVYEDYILSNSKLDFGEWLLEEIKKNEKDQIK